MGTTSPTWGVKSHAQCGCVICKRYDFNWLGFKARTIPDGTVVSASTVISRTLHKAGTYTGMFPFDENGAWAKNTAYVRHLSELAARIKALEQRLSKKENEDG